MTSNSSWLTLSFAALTATLLPIAHAQAADADETNAVEANAVETSSVAVSIDLGYESKYISEGRNNLEDGGISWGMFSAQDGKLTTYALVGRAAQQHYIEWQLGFEYAIELGADIEASVGYQRVEVYGDERESDNELFASATYTGSKWIEPSVEYTYSTENAGYFVEVSLQHHWQATEQLTISPYAIQGFDFQYATEHYNGPNHFQFGAELAYAISDSITINGHISRTIAQEDIKREYADDSDIKLNETFAGFSINMTW
ncbi:hypothetical protein EXU30_09170 [Shewanella maritima]|uniref:DUF481 domain-containing protein n=1 Tax=Shewanella maritima TaxID=2520507 RepID=A0A411PHA0_9GAMM|nr:hypothetical protein [Shewanella maritima]QBF82844.1 hypothetical protein EXU30_09170 [Shewanella maritima]